MINLPASIRDNSGKILNNEGEGCGLQPAASQNNKQGHQMLLNMETNDHAGNVLYYLVAECWSARMIVSRQEVRLSVRDREVSQRDFKSARSYLRIHE